MKIFLLVSLIWSIILYIVNKYQVPIIHEDADHVIEGIWVLLVPMTGLIYGGITLGVLKLMQWLKAKLL